MLKKVFEVKVYYEDGTEEVLMITSPTESEATCLAESWVDYRKTVKEIKVIGEVGRRKRHGNNR